MTPLPAEACPCKGLRKHRGGENLGKPGKGTVDPSLGFLASMAA